MSPYELWVFGGLGGSLLSMLNRATITLHHRILPDQILICILFSSNQVLYCKYVWLHHKSIQKLGNSTMLPILVWWCLESNQILLLTMLYYIVLKLSIFIFCYHSVITSGCQGTLLATIFLYTVHYSFPLFLYFHTT